MAPCFSFYLSVWLHARKACTLRNKLQYVGNWRMLLQHAADQ